MKLWQLLVLGCFLHLTPLDLLAERPNLIVILADDMGPGDIRALNPECRFPTPHLDQLAHEGMVFTDAHSSSSVCTPTRYSLLTGRYNWRSRLSSGVLGGYSPPLIEPGRMTIASFLKAQGYHTACIGKWHLGLDIPLKAGGFARTYEDAWKVDYEQPIQRGPQSVGFDDYFGISASLDMPPFLFIEGDRFVGVPTVEKKWVRLGPAQRDFEAVDVLPKLIERMIACIDEKASPARAGNPFLIYLPLTAPHTPILPTQEWQGKSGLNDYGDFVMQVDDGVGQLLAALKRNDLDKQTLIVFTADNGCSPAAGIEAMQQKGHFPSLHYRGYKADLFDGGHRVPFLVRWPGHVPAGAVSDQLVCLTDLFATVAELVDVPLPDNAAEDSISFLPALKQSPNEHERKEIVHHSINGAFTIRQGKWKLLVAPDSGGWSPPRPRDQVSGLPLMQLYDLSADIGEKKNVVAEHPEVVVGLIGLLRDDAERGRSTPGENQPNTGEVDIFRGIPKSRRSELNQ